MNLRFLFGDKPTPHWVLTIFRAVASLLVFAGALLEFSVAWNIGDILMGLMALINLPVIIILGNKAIRCALDYQKQRKAGLNPTFKASSIGITQKLDYWQD